MSLFLLDGDPTFYIFDSIEEVFAINFFILFWNDSKYICASKYYDKKTEFLYSSNSGWK